MHRYRAMVEHWKENGPPAYMVLAAHYGLIKPKTKASDLVQDPNDLAQILSQMPGGSVT